MIYVSAIFNFQFLDPLKTEKLSHAADCSIVGKAKLPLSCIFPFIVDRIEVKIWFMFQHSIFRKKSQIFDLALSYFLW